jgi:glycyl-tRNA synthetase
MHAVVKKYSMKSPSSGSELSEPVDFNLMFSTSIGPGGGIKAFLRPETAQGIFVNFKRLLDFNQGKLPFGVAQIGNSFRNEISPRAGLIRVREFTMAEIEYFLDPTDKNHPRFHEVKDLKLNLYSACNQMDGESSQQVPLGEAVDKKLIANETLAYFMARIHLFLIKVGVDPVRLRFRQHMGNEMAHYACDCWDAEILTSYGWIECVGCADRSCFDLTQHTLATGVKLSAEKKLEQPKEVRIKACLPNKGVIGKLFKADAKAITEAFANLSVSQVDDLTAAVSSDTSFALSVKGKDINITKEMVILKDEMKTVHVEEVTPSVIEPSFGIGRIMYAVYEHNFRQREEDEQRTYLSLPALIAPYKCSILPLSAKPEFVPFIQKLSKDLRRFDISFKVDDGSGSVGRRYARTDEIAIPFGVTIDFDTLSSNPSTVTLRERDSREQLRIPLDDIPQVVQDLSLERKTWQEVSQVYPRFTEQENKGQ